MRVRQVQLASHTDLHQMLPTAEILDEATADRTRRTAEAGSEGMVAWSPIIPPLTRGQAIATERDLYLHIFSGNSATSRRKAFRDWRRISRDRYGSSRHGVEGRSAPANDSHRRAEGAMTHLERDAAYAKLTSPAAALYRQLGFGPFRWLDGDLLAALTDMESPAGERLADTLVHAGLLEADDGGFVLSTDAHLHARFTVEQCEADEDELNAAGLDRLLTFLRDAAGSAERLITPSHRTLWERATPIESEPPFPLDEQAALSWLEKRLPVYMDAIRFAFADRRYALVCDLAHGLYPLWLRRRHPVQRLEALTLGLTAATVLRNDRAVGQMLTSLAGAVRSTNPAAAYGYDRTAALHYQETGDSVGLAQSLNGMGEVALGAGALDEADQHFSYAEELLSGLGYVRGTALSRQGRGRVELARGNTETAAELLFSAHQMLLGCGDDYDSALALAHYAEAVAALGEIDAALAELAVALTQAATDFGQAEIWEIRARILATAEFQGPAEEAQRRAQSLYERVAPSADERVRAAPSLR